jgi:hypothetical protein
MNNDIEFFPGEVCCQSLEQSNEEKNPGFGCLGVAKSTGIILVKQ